MSNETRKLTDEEINAKFVYGNPANIRYSCQHMGREVKGVVSEDDLSERLRRESLRAGIGFVAQDQYVAPLTDCTAPYKSENASGHNTESRKVGLNSEYVPASPGEERCALAPYCKAKNKIDGVPPGADWKRDTLLSKSITG
ncbi:MAG: hypothetical protein HY831_04515 [Candidatus Aenigmarchaeota archaeon]|nr:hypothetical protein [Candidatus Aenigmarchaeota archaeon]